MNMTKKIGLALCLIVGSMALEGCRINARIGFGHGRGDEERWCGRDRWGERYCDSYKVTGNDESVKFVSHDKRVAKVSDSYDISHYAATHVVRALVLAEKNDVSGLTQMGLSKADVQKAINGEQLSERKIDRIGTKLNMTNPDTAILIENIAAQYRQN